MRPSDLSAALFAKDESKEVKKKDGTKEQASKKPAYRDRAAERREGKSAFDEGPFIDAEHSIKDDVSDDIRTEDIDVSTLIALANSEATLNLSTVYISGRAVWSRPRTIQQLQAKEDCDDGHRAWLLQLKAAKQALAILSPSSKDEITVTADAPSVSKRRFPELAPDGLFGPEEMSTVGEAAPDSKKPRMAEEEVHRVVERGGLFGFSDDLPRLDRLHGTPSHAAAAEAKAETVEQGDDDGEDPMLAFKKGEPSSEKRLRFNVIGDDAEDELYAVGTAADILPPSRLFLDDNEAVEDDGAEDGGKKKGNKKLDSQLAQIERMLGRRRNKQQ